MNKKALIKHISGGGIEFTNIDKSVSNVNKNVTAIGTILVDPNSNKNPKK
jgi:hypothetical protein